MIAAIASIYIMKDIERSNRARDRSYLKQYDEMKAAPKQNTSAWVGRIVDFEDKGDVYRIIHFQSLGGKSIKFIASKDTKGSNYRLLSRGDIVSAYLSEYVGWKQATELEKLEETVSKGSVYSVETDRLRIEIPGSVCCKLFYIEEGTEAYKLLRSLRTEDEVKVYSFGKKNDWMPWANRIKKFYGIWILGIYL